MSLFEVNEKDALETYNMYMRRTPSKIVAIVLNYLKEKIPGGWKSAVDVGCGAGQNTFCFAPYFQHVRGFDLSELHIAQARTTANVPHNVSFTAGAAESVPLPDESVELVTGCNSFHWFDHSVFNAEADRILVPNGVVAVIGYFCPHVANTTKSDQMNVVLDKVFAAYMGMVSPNTMLKVRTVLNCYRDLPLPYSDEVRFENVDVDVEGTLDDVLGYYEAVAKFAMLYKEDPKGLDESIAKLKKDLTDILCITAAPNDIPITMRYHYFLAMCRKPRN